MSCAEAQGLLSIEELCGLNPKFSDTIIYEHDGIIAVNKPAGIASTGRTLEDKACVQYLAMEHYRRKIWAVHQLDRQTSGVFIMVRRKALVEQWQKRLAHAFTKKVYFAIIHGGLTLPIVEVNAPLAMRGRVPNRQMVVESTGKNCRSIFREIARVDNYSFIEATIVTGRTHQIRAHLQHLGLSLVGEQRYRDKPCDLHPRQALHAAKISFGDADIPAMLSAPLPEDLRQLADSLGLIYTGECS